MYKVIVLSVVLHHFPDGPFGEDIIRRLLGAGGLRCGKPDESADGRLGLGGWMGRCQPGIGRGRCHSGLVAGGGEDRESGCYPGSGLRSGGHGLAVGQHGLYLCSPVVDGIGDGGLLVALD